VSLKSIDFRARAGEQSYEKKSLIGGRAAHTHVFKYPSPV